MGGALAAALLSVVTAPFGLAASTGSWVTSPTPNVTATTNNEMYGVTCVTASDCWAVGEEDVNGPATLIEQYNGSNWSTVSGPSVTDNQLNSVTCVSASDCWAAGYQQPSGQDQVTLIVHYNGSAWSVVSSPNTCGTCVNTGSDILNSVTCVTASDCWAIGTSDGSNGPQTLTEQYDGTGWNIVSSPNPSNTYQLSLNGVACAATTECLAVGQSNNQTLVEAYDGTSWSIVSSPNPSSTYQLSLNGVSCAAANECWAVGKSNSQTLIEGFDGSAWSIVSSPNPSSTYLLSLNGVGCASVTECWAVGESNNKTLTEQYDGTSWSIASSADTSGSDHLEAVACATATDCWTVGYDQFVPPNGVPQSLIEQNSGTGWNIVSSQQIPFALDNHLLGVTCAAYNFCLGVGYYVGYFGSNQTLIEYNGKVVTSPNNGLGNQLNGVTCVSVSDCWAVGFGRPLGVQETLTEQYNGISWSKVSSPNSGSGNNYLYGVTCVTATDCWAVGNSVSGPQSSGTASTLIEQYTSGGWAVVTSPNNGTGNNYLNSVACANANDCWAVGDDVVSSPLGNVTQTLIEQFNGTSWNTVTSPNPSSATTSVLNGVTCTSASNCWAVGESRIQTTLQTTNFQTVIERYNGTSWSIVTSPNNGSNDNVLNGVSCATPSFCLAAGHFTSSSGATDTLIEQDTGSGWSIVSTPNVSTYENSLNAINCTSGCWAVGDYYNLSLGAYQTLDLRHVGDPTKTTVSCAPNPVAVTKQTKCTAHVTDLLIPLNTPTGTISWSGGTGTFSSKTCWLSAGSCSVTFTPSAATTQTITGKYTSNTAQHLSSSGSTTLHVT